MNFELNFEQLQKKLKKVLNPSRFRFVVILYPNTNMIDEIKEHISSIYPESSTTSLDLKDKSYQEIAPELYKNDDGFVYINDFDEILNNPDLYNGFNQRRDKIASFNINLICFISLYQKDELFTKAINVIPDLWEFKNTVLELEKDDNTDKLSDIKISEGNSYSSIGGLTTKDKEIELKKLLERLKTTNNDELKLNILFQIATIYKDLGNLHKSLYYLKLQLGIQEKYENNNKYIAIIYNNIALLLRQIGDLAQALKYQQKDLEIKEGLINGDMIQLATSYNNLSLIYSEMGNLEKAFFYQKKDLKILEKNVNENHLNLATGYTNIALLYNNSGDFKKAFEYENKALKIKLKSLREQHPDVAVSYENLGSIYFNMGNLSKALEYQEKNLKIKEEILGENHPSFAQSCYNISTIYQTEKNCKKAKYYLEKCIKIIEEFKYTIPVYSIAKKNLQQVNLEIKKQKKAGFRKLGKYCKDM